MPCPPSILKSVSFLLHGHYVKLTVPIKSLTPPACLSPSENGGHHLSNPLASCTQTLNVPAATSPLLLSRGGALPTPSLPGHNAHLPRVTTECPFRPSAGPVSQALWSWSDLPVVPVSPHSHGFSSASATSPSFPWACFLCRPSVYFSRPFLSPLSSPSVRIGPSPLLPWPQLLPINQWFPKILQVGFLSWSPDHVFSHLSMFPHIQKLNFSPPSPVLLPDSPPSHRVQSPSWPAAALSADSSLTALGELQPSWSPRRVPKHTCSLCLPGLCTNFSFCRECCLLQPLLSQPLKITWLIPA